MQKGSNSLGQTYVLRLPPGEDLLVGLYRVCRELDLTFGLFSVTGAVRGATVGHMDQESGAIKRRIFDVGQDLVSCSGNVSPQGGSFRVHAYAVLSDAEGNVSAGELLAAEIYVAEVVLQELKGKSLKRRLDPETGLWLWPVR